jgi:hypothetical protein
VKIRVEVQVALLAALLVVLFVALGCSVEVTRAGDAGGDCSEYGYGDPATCGAELIGQYAAPGRPDKPLVRLVRFGDGTVCAFARYEGTAVDCNWAPNEPATTRGEGP